MELTSQQSLVYSSSRQYEYKLSSGKHVGFDRIPRALLDDFEFNHPPPIPPLIEVPAFGGTELMEDFDDESYLSELNEYSLATIFDRMGLASPYLDEFGELDEYASDIMERESLPSMSAMTPTDRNLLLDQMWYVSTVTVRGLDEAARRFNVTWMDKLIIPSRASDTGKLGEQPLKHSQYFYDYEAAVESGYMWNVFCGMTGQEQSGVVSHHWLNQRVKKYLSRGHK